MLSVLIPTYNHSCVSLVKEIAKQIRIEKIDAEIIVADDGSTNLNTIAENSKIEQIDGCRLSIAPKNMGIARTRNRLMREARGQNLLFLDSDVFPVNPDFVRRYLAAANNADVIVGGITYRTNGPVKINPLRLRYGIERESKTLAQRQTEKQGFISCNFMVNRRIAETIRFDESFDRYGHEDTLFGISLEMAGFKIGQIDAPVYHDNNDSSEQFLEKTRVAIQSLTMHFDELADCSRLAKSYAHLTTLHLTHLVGAVYKYFRPYMEKNLLGEKPSLVLLDIYKLSYLCKIFRL